MRGIEKQEKSMYAINALYVPLGISSPVYKNKLVILCDKPNTKQKENDRDSFLNANSHLKSNRQYFELPFESIENYYPKPWTKNDSELKILGNTQNAKITLAREVSAKITKEQFEKEMELMFQSLSRCWELAFK